MQRAGVAPSTMEALKERVERLEARLAESLTGQERRFADAMKFAVLRHMSVMSLLLELSPAPPKVVGALEAEIQQAIQDIAVAKDLGRVQEIDVALQQRLRHAVLTYGKP